MGVKSLWPELESVRERRSLASFAGCSLAVDLGFWLCEMQTALNKHKQNEHAYLRSLFFRLNALLQHDIRVVLVADGTPPDLKHQVIRERLGAEAPAHSTNTKQRKITRSRFNAKMRLCSQLASALGVSVVQSGSEAECTCAHLNATGVVDGVITDDSDALLYGATLILRNFSLDGKEPMIDCYSAQTIQQELALDRHKLIAMGLLCGCDYLPKGVPAIGPKKAVQFLRQFDNGPEALDRLIEGGSDMDHLTDKLNVLALSNQSHSHIFSKVVNEFLRPNVEPLELDLHWKRPDVQLAMTVLCGRLQWTEEYSLCKVLALLSVWSLCNIEQSTALQAHALLAARTRNGLPMYEVQWHRLAHDEDSVSTQQYYVTLECAKRVAFACPRLVTEFEQNKAKKKAERKKTTKKTSKAKVAVTQSSDVLDKKKLTDIRSYLTVPSAEPDLNDSLVVFDCDSDNEQENQAPLHQPTSIQPQQTLLLNNQPLQPSKGSNQSQTSNHLQTTSAPATIVQRNLVPIGVDQLEDSLNDALANLSLHTQATRPVSSDSSDEEGAEWTGMTLSERVYAKMQSTQQNTQS